MKTRILAIALVCLMVVAMLPVSVLAADYKCPGTGKDHNKLNCEYTVVDVVPAETCKTGWTVYECKECGAEFAADIVPAGHNFVLTKHVSQSCTVEEHDLLTCTNCGVTKKDNVVAGTKAHDWVETGVYDDNERPVKKCSVCNKAFEYEASAGCSAENYVNGEHTWKGIIPEIITAPNGATDGVAKYTCDKCGYSEELKIHNHKLTSVAEVKATCNAVGYSADHVYCELCGLRFDDAADAAAWDVADITITAALNHGYDSKTGEYAEGFLGANVRNQTLPSCKDGIVGSEERQCTKCNEWVKLTLSGDHTPDTPKTVGATCMNAGYKVVDCKVCKTNLETTALTFDAEKVKDHNKTYEDKDIAKLAKETGFATEVLKVALAYKSWTVIAPDDKEAAKKSVLPTCLKAGEIVIYCEICKVTKTVPVAALGHDVETVTVPATCKTWGFTYDVCKRSGCAADDVNVLTAKKGVFTVTATDNSTQNVDAKWNLVQGSKTNLKVWEFAGEDILYIAGSLTFVSKEDKTSHRNNRNVLVAANPDDCTTDEQYMAVCMYCAADSGLQIDEGEDAHVFYNHTLVKGTEAYEDEFGADDDDIYDKVVNQEKAGPTCIADGVVTVQCKNCKVMSEEKKVADKHQDFKTAEYEYATVAELKTYHKNATQVQVITTGDCVYAQVEQWSCTDCKSVSLVVRDSTSYGSHKMPEGTKHWEATCTTDAYRESWECARGEKCSEYDKETGKAFVQAVVYENDTDSTKNSGGLGHLYTSTAKAYLVTKKIDAKATENGTYEVRKCCREGCTGSWKVIDSNLETTEYTTEAAATTAAVIKSWHSNPDNWNNVVAKVPYTCTETGTNAYYTCKCCNDGKKWNTNNAGYDADGKILSTTFAYDETGKTATKDDDLVIGPGAHVYANVYTLGADGDCTTIEFAHYNCSVEGCDAQYITSLVIAADDHTKGDYPKDYAGPKNTDKPATCEGEGEDFFYCTKCKTERSETLEAIGHKNAKGETLELDCANLAAVSDRVCVACKKLSLPEADYTIAPKKDYAYNSFATDDDPKTTADDDKMVVGFHNAGKVTKTVTAPSCEDDGSTLYYCTVCNWSETVIDPEEDKATGHKYEQNKIVADPTADAPGLVTCDYGCGTTKEMAGVEYTLAVKNAIVDGAALTDGSLITVVVSVKGLPAANVGSIDFTITHSANVEFVEAKSVSGFDFGSAAAASATTVKGSYIATAGSVNVTEEVAAIELTFRVVAYDDKLVKIGSTENKIDFAVTAASAIGAVALGAAEVEEFIEVTDNAKAETEYEELLDFNGDGTVTQIDFALAFQTATTLGAEYNSMIDVDRNGKIEISDVIAMNKFMVGDKEFGYLVLVDRVPETKPEVTPAP